MVWNGITEAPDVESEGFLFFWFRFSSRDSLDVQYLSEIFSGSRTMDSITFLMSQLTIGFGGLGIRSKDKTMSVLKLRCVFNRPTNKAVSGFRLPTP